MMERIVPGRWPTLKPPTLQELKATTVVSLALEEVVAKARSGPPKDDPEDFALDVWAGVVPISTVIGHPVRDRSEEHTSELQSLMRISNAVFCLIKKKHHEHN